MNRFQPNRTTRALTLLVTSMLLIGSLFGGSAVADNGNPGNGNPPSVECGVDDPLYNKFQYEDGLSFDEASDPPGQIVTLSNEDGDSVDYAVTDDDYILVKIVWKIGEGNDSEPPDPLEDENGLPTTGTLEIPDKLSHITFCFAVAPDGPDRPQVSASIDCNADPVTGVATYTLNVDTPEGVTTEPADGAVVDNEDTTVTVTWEGGTFDVTAEKTEDCSFTPEEPPTPPTVTASTTCTADPETGVPTYTLNVVAPEGVTTTPADGATVDPTLTEITVHWAGDDFTVPVVQDEDCSFTPEEPPTPQANPAASLAESCDSGVTASLSNTGDAPVTFTISKNGSVVDTVAVAGGDSATKTYSLAEDEAATFSIVAAGLTTVTQSFTHDCVTPPSPPPTPPTIPTLVLGEKIVAPAPAAATQVQGVKLPATGADPIPMAWLAIAFLALGTMLVRMSRPTAVFVPAANGHAAWILGPGRRSSGWSWKLEAGRRSNGFEWGWGLSRRRR